MIRKRLAAAIVVRRGIAVQSFGYGRWLPMGDAAVIAQNYDRWGADEIVLQVIDRGNNGPDLDLLERINRIGLSTPLVYGGGIRNVADAVAAVKRGADRLSIDSLLRDGPGEIDAIAESLGAQAVIASLPLSVESGRIMWRDYRKHTDSVLTPAVLDLLAGGRISEVLAVDWQHEGHMGSFDPQIIELFPLSAIPKIAFGGLGDPAMARRLLERDDIAAIAIGNPLSWNEHAIQHMKRRLPGMPLRQASFSGLEVPA